jgi:hypothetical protein
MCFQGANARRFPIVWCLRIRSHNFLDIREVFISLRYPFK